MKDREMGFIHGAPKNVEIIWETEINGATYIFKKSRDERGFLYNCKRLFEDGGAQTGFVSGRDYTPQQVERLRQFDHFIAR